MSSQTMSGAGSKRSLVIILAVVAVIALILGVLWMAGAAPSFLDSGSHVHKASGGHFFRGGAAIVIGLVCGAGAWWAGKK
jgi:hypothetical protein